MQIVTFLLFNCTQMSLHTCADRSLLTYTAFYCEENIWKLCERIQCQQCDQVDQCYAVFISNHKEMIPIWGQRLGNKEKGHLVVWDYHVIMLHRRQDGTTVYDFDTILKFPVDFEVYCQNNLREEQVSVGYEYRFRVVPAEQFLHKFASDRSRMRDKDGQYIKPPPNYDFIQTDSETNNLNSFISMDGNFPIGQVMDLKELRQRFGSKK